MFTFVACPVQAELGQMTTTVYYDANSVALDSRLVILQIHSHIEFNISHTSQQVHVFL